LGGDDSAENSASAPAEAVVAVADDRGLAVEVRGGLKGGFFTDLEQLVDKGLVFGREGPGNCCLDF
jgi:hypothetical protein